MPLPEQRLLAACMPTSRRRQQHRSLCAIPCRRRQQRCMPCREWGSASNAGGELAAAPWSAALPCVVAPLCCSRQGRALPSQLAMCSHIVCHPWRPPAALECSPPSAARVPHCCDAAHAARRRPQAERQAAARHGGRADGLGDGLPVQAGAVWRAARQPVGAGGAAGARRAVGPVQVGGGRPPGWARPWWPPCLHARWPPAHAPAWLRSRCIASQPPLQALLMPC